MAPPQEFGVDVQPTDGIVVVRVRGELDMSTAEAFADSLTGAGTSGVTVVADLSEVSFIDSSALSALISSGRAVASAGGRLEIGPRSPAVARVLEITGLADGTADFGVQSDGRSGAPDG